jgi:glutamyl-tRNA(Gln) amidotransferase subunit E
MTSADYASVGFRCGLEVHQQLLTGRKLFCRCPAGRYSWGYDAQILRHMRPTLSEMGEYDGTALMEKKTRKNIIYRLHRETVCTYEFDDTPPFPIDPEAIDIALRIALLFRLNLVDELHIARKQYLDGSIPTGFQRTTILGTDGWIPWGEGRIRIRQLGLEEDSCREVSDVGHDRTYMTDRLGMPLVEIVTEPDMRTPQEAAAVCRLIGRVYRSTQQVRRGCGATRQDVNVSVEGGTRVEIKGVPQFWRIPRLVHNEAQRQVSLLRIRDELRRRGVTPESIQAAGVDVAGIVGRHARAVVLRRFGGLLLRPIQEGTLFASEFSDRLRVIACLSELPNMAHRGDRAFLGPAEWQAIERQAGLEPEDEVIVVWGPPADVATACGEIEIRAREAATGVPSDTRQPLPDGTTGFERVLPGPQRMYPDTDLPPIAITRERADRARRSLPDFVWDSEARFRAGGMVEDDVQRLAVSGRCALAARAMRELGLSARLLGVVLCQQLRALARRGLAPARLADEALFDLLAAHASGRIAREGIGLVLERALSLSDAAIGAPALRRVIDDLGLRPADRSEIDRRVAAELDGSESRQFDGDADRQRWLMGRLMDGLRGRAPGREVAQRLQARRGAPRGAQGAPA